jgi:hypothetical protein
MVMLAPNFPKEAGEILQRIKRLCAEFGHDAKGEFTYHDLIVTWQFIANITVLVASTKPKNPPEVVRHRRVSMPGQHMIVYHKTTPQILHAGINGVNKTLCGETINSLFWEIERGFQQVTCKACMNSIVGPT